MISPLTTPKEPDVAMSMARVDSASAAEVAAAEEELAAAERAVADEAKRPRGNGTALLAAESHRSRAATRLERARRRAELVQAQLNPLSDLERARLDVVATEHLVDELLKQPATSESTDRLLAAGARRDRAKLVLQRQETYAAELAAKASARTALIESHQDRIKAITDRLVAAQGVLADAMRARQLVQVGAACDDFNEQLSKGHAQLAGFGLVWWTEGDRTGAGRHGVVAIDGEPWLPVDASMAIVWTAAATISARSGDRVVLDTLTGVTGRGSNGWAARHPGLMAAVDGKSPRGRGGRPTGPQAA